jgi:hypothetical protein
MACCDAVPIHDNKAVNVEDLAVSGLARTRLAKSMHDAGLAETVNGCGGTARPGACPGRTW